MRSKGAILAAVFVLAAARLAYAVSDGNYDPLRQHCSGAANNNENFGPPEPACHNWTLVISDFGGHEYVGWGIRQTAQNPSDPNALYPDNNPHAFDVWYDVPGQGGCQNVTVDLISGQATQGDGGCLWFDPSYTFNPSAPNNENPSPQPDSGLRLYFGADDNLDFGEHDSSSTVNNGPSDGGAIQLNLSVDALMDFINNPPSTLDGAHPLPAADAGFGFCADGFCFSLQTTRRAAYPGSDSHTGAPPRDVANYQDKQWDPFNCSGATDTTTDCSDPTHPNFTPADWNNQNGPEYVEPGVQIYEDPDAQGSPAGPSYPIPSIYVGTCGVIVGGGAINSDQDTPNELAPVKDQVDKFVHGPLQASLPQAVIPTGLCPDTMPFPTVP